MKKLRIVLPTILFIIVIGLSSAYFIYGATLIDITSDKSISNTLAADPEQPITVIETAKNDDFFGILYSDPSDEDDELYHFRYITKAKLYRNKYRNTGGGGTVSNASDICYDVLNRGEENNNTVKAFLYTTDSNLFENNKCSVFEYNSDGCEIDFSEITDETQIIEKMQKLANSYKKIAEFDLPNKDIYIIPKSYELSQPENQISFVNGSVSVEEIKQRIMDEAELIVSEYYEYSKSAVQ